MPSSPPASPSRSPSPRRPQQAAQARSPSPSPLLKKAHPHPPAATTNPTASPATFSPRRPPTSSSSTSMAVATQDTLMAAAVASYPTTTTTPGGHHHATSANGSTTTGSSNTSGNPHVRAIQSRVAELVRLYDESMVSGSDADDDDDDIDEHGNRRIDVPARWRVGDLLMATHSSLAKTSTRTERSMISEFADDLEVSSAIGEGEHNFSLVFQDATQKADQMKAVLAKTLQVVQQMHHSDALYGDATGGGGASGGGSGSQQQQQQMRDLRITLDALHKEKHMILVQLHEHIKSHKEMMATVEDHNHELKKSQIACAMKNDELKNVREEFALKIAELQKMGETSQQNVTLWRDKYQAALKTLGELELKMGELEKKSSGQGEEVMKHEFVARAKNAEMDKLKERLKESEIARMKAEAALKDSETSAVVAAGKAAATSSGGAGANSKSDVKQLAAMKQEMEAKIRQQDATIKDLKAKLSDLTQTRGKFEEDNNELARIVREMQMRAQELMDPNARSPVSSSSSGMGTAALAATAGKPVMRRSVSSFSLSFKRESSHHKKRASLSSGGSRRGRGAGAGRADDDDLSTSSSDDDDDVDEETARDERELNHAVQQVVTSVFPEREASALGDHSDELISDSIAQYEADPTNHQSMGMLGSDGSPLPPERRTAPSDMEQMQLAHADEIALLKKQYVTTLLEYKKLIIEQYERRQNEIQQHHRMEIENLILLVQAKFKKELERRGECMMQAKESLKLLYRAMQTGVPGMGGRKLGAFDEDGDDSDPGGERADERVVEDESVPLKSILRAAVFAMSSSKQRNQQAAETISNLYDTVHKKKGSLRKPVVTVTVKKNAKTKQSSTEQPSSVGGAEPDSKDTDWAAFLKNMRANRDEASTRLENGGAKAVVVHVACQVDDSDFVIFDLKGLRGTHVTPENVTGYVLPSLSLYSSSSSSGQAAAYDTVETLARRASPRRDHRGDVLNLVKGALLDDDLVADLRAVLPFLPPGSYYLSATLRHQLMVEMLRFYSDLGRHHSQQQHQQHHQQQQREAAVAASAVEVLVGSPRDTPFMRRKAVESVDRKQRRRSELLSNGGMAMLQQLLPVTLSSAATSPWTAVSSKNGFTSKAPMSHVRHGNF